MVGFSIAVKSVPIECTVRPWHRARQGSGSQAPCRHGIARRARKARARACQISELVADLGDVLLGGSLDLIAGQVVIPEMPVVKQAVAACAAQRCRQQADALGVADRFDVDAGAFRQRADGQRDRSLCRVRTRHLGALQL